MAEVLHYPRKPSGQSYYSSPGLKRSSHSYSSFLAQQSSTYSPSSNSPPSPPSSHNPLFSSHSLPSSTATSSYPSYSDLSNPSVLPPTPASSVSFEDKEERVDEDIAFPSYDDGVQFYHQDEPLDLPSSPSDDSDASSTAQEEPQTMDPKLPDSPLLTPTVADDSAVKQLPSRHVDYLSHDWREEDIWASWRHIVSLRKKYGQKSRLENASWRTWGKSKYKLSTVSPEKLNWLKESDVTWLYGPLQPATSHPITHCSPNPSPSHLTSQSSFVTKKPILKKRSMSETMLMKSLSANSLLKQAAASVQAQQTTFAVASPAVARATSKASEAAPPSHPISRDQLDYFSTLPSSGNNTPSEGGKRHIRFDDKVEQCIAVECQNVFDDDDDMEPSDSSDSDSSDEGMLTMRKSRKRRPTVGRKPPSRSSSASNKIIEKLPDTTLKYKTESPEVSRTSIQLPFLKGWGSTKLAQSPSQETLRPSNPSKNFLLQHDDEQDVDSEMSWQPSGAYGDRKDSASPVKTRSLNFDDEPSNMRRTESGMFMPYDEDEEETAMQLGLFGRVSETINTAKDIAHVIWNVGWRK